MRDPLHVDHDASLRGYRARRGKAAYVALALAMLAGACVHARPPSDGPVPPPAQHVTVVTWNLHGGAGDLPALLDDLRTGGLTYGVPPRDFVVLLQEASPKNRIGDWHWFFAPARQVDGTARGNAILSSLPLVDARTIALPRERQPRVAAFATVRIDGVDLNVVNVHLENRASWWKGGLPGDTARARQMNALLAQLPEGPGILGGDLNVWLGPREPALRAAAGRYPDGVTRDPRPTFRERLELDHLFFRLPARWKAVQRRADDRYGSDHFPVVAMLATG